MNLKENEVPVNTVSGGEVAMFDPKIKLVRRKKLREVVKKKNVND